ncbi:MULTISPECIES: hypothetical protein [unclassified Synechococcus]|uniref:hypothetical protein n=1 Tax=unclassified Synechococcus TaxID=2626047 RepID=UPI0013C4DCCE|nr:MULTISPECIES: hypothetical protein [unclassified Synechococcus]
MPLLTLLFQPPLGLEDPRLSDPLAWWNPVREPLPDPLDRPPLPPRLPRLPPRPPPPRPPPPLAIRWCWSCWIQPFQACHWPPLAGSGGTIDQRPGLPRPGRAEDR